MYSQFKKAEILRCWAKTLSGQITAKKCSVSTKFVYKTLKENPDIVDITKSHRRTIVKINDHLPKKKLILMGYKPREINSERNV